MKQEIMTPQRELIHFFSDSLVWLEFENKSGFAKGDIIIADPFKAGTTWPQRVVDTDT